MGRNLHVLRFLHLSICKATTSVHLIVAFLLAIHNTLRERGFVLSRVCENTENIILRGGLQLMADTILVSFVHWKQYTYRLVNSLPLSPVRFSVGLAHS